MRVCAQQAGSLDASFSPGFGVDGSVNALAAQPDGKIIVAGQFDHVNAAAYDNLARLNVDGSLDAAFVPPAIDGAFSFASATVRALALQPDGRILIGGSFAKVGGVAHLNLARLNADGSLDAGFSASFGVQSGVVHFSSAGVYALALEPDGKIVAAGSFDLVNGQPRRGVARLNADGSLDASFDPAAPANVFPPQGLDNDAFALALGPTGEVYVAGDFKTINGVSQPDLARLRSANGSLDGGFAPALGSFASVDAIACQPDGRLLVAGSLVQPADKSTNARGDIARFNADGSPDVEFSRKHGNGSSAFSAIQAIVVQPQDGSILIAGDHLYLNDRPVGAMGRYLADGRVDKSFYPGLDPLAASNAAPKISAVTVRADGSIIVGGDFDTADGEFRHHLAGLRGSPSADCPAVNVRASQPLAIAGSGGDPAVQDGKFVLTIQEPLTAPLNINYSVSGQGIYLVNSKAFSTDALTIAPGARKAKLRVHPRQYASPGAGGKNIKLEVEAGRGYIVGESDAAKVRVVADGAASE